MSRADDADGADANPALCFGESASPARPRTAAVLVALERLQLGCECPVSYSSMRNGGCGRCVRFGGIAILRVLGGLLGSRLTRS
jgi:hypothetical protein